MINIVITAIDPESPTYGTFEVASLQVSGEWVYAEKFVSIERLFCKGGPVNCGDTCPLIDMVRWEISRRVTEACRRDQ